MKSKREVIMMLNNFTINTETENTQMRMLLIFTSSILMLNIEERWIIKNIDALDKIMSQVTKSTGKGRRISDCRMNICDNLKELAMSQEGKYVRLMLGFAGTLIFLKKEVSWVKGNRKLINQVGERALKQL